MNEKLISGYAAYTTADEYSASATGDAPATWTVLATVGLVYYSAVGGSGFVYSLRNNC